MLGFPGSDGSSLGHRARVGSVIMEPRSRMAVVVAANKDYMGEVWFVSIPQQRLGHRPNQ